MRKYNSVTYEVGKAKAEQAAGMFGLAAGQRAASCPSRVAKPLAKPLPGGPSEHWLKIRTNNMLERLNREIRRRTRVVGTFPDGESALMLVCARLRHVTGTQWGVKRYMSMKSLEQMDREKHGADCCDLA